MKRVLFASIIALALAQLAMAQSELAEFPVGTTEMSYRIVSEGLTEPQLLTLTITGLPDGRYRVRLTTEATGTPDQLGLFGFLLGTTSVQAGMGDVDFSALAALLPHRQDLALGEDYILPDGGTFHAEERKAIAGVECLLGTYTTPQHPGTRIILAFSLNQPVLIAPLIRVERRAGSDWKTSFELELTGYSFRK